MAEEINYSVQGAEPQLDRDSIIRNMATDVLNHERRVREEELMSDPDFIQAAKMAYEGVGDEPFTGTDQEAVQMGLDMASRFNYNITGMGIQLAKLQDAPDENKLAMYYIVDTLDKKDVTKAGVGRFFRELALDPMNYVFGAGVATKVIGGESIKHGAMQMLKEGAERYFKKYGSLAGQGAIMEAKAEAGRQQLEKEAKVREEMDIGEIGEAAAIGTAGALGITHAAEALGKGVKKVLSKQEANTEVANGTN